MFEFLKRNKKTKERKFWDWFTNNKSGLEKFITSDLTDYRLYNRLTGEIKKYNALLFPEITISKDNKFVLIITPDGMPDGVVPTQNLFNEKPEIKNWIIKKFRQPLDTVELNFDGIEYALSDIKVKHYVDYDREKIDIKVFVKDFDKADSRKETLAWLYMDHVLGEYNTITKVGAVIFRDWKNIENENDLLSLLEIRKLIESELYKATN